MKRFLTGAGAFIILASFLCISTPAYSYGYRFDDLQGPNGVGAQWMIVTESGKTLGASHSTAMNISGDLLNGEAVLEIMNGETDDTISDSERLLHTIFVVMNDSYGSYDINFRTPDTTFDPATPNLELSRTDTSDAGSYNLYFSGKSPIGEYTDTWRGYNFILQRDLSTHNSVEQYLNFMQIPGTSSSQAIPKPIIISSVNSGTAEDEPLILRMTLRDSATTSRGNITAYTRALWRVNSDLDAGNDQWVFVPVDDLNTDNKTINYYLTTEVANHTSYRYEANTYDSYGSWNYPNAWKFDLTRYQGTTNVEHEIYLADMSHIAPGLVSVFRRAYNVNEQNKRPLRLHRIDTPSDAGYYDLRLHHRVIFGRSLGMVNEPASQGGFNLYEITGYEPKTDSMKFYDDVAAKTGSTLTVRPLTSTFSPTVKRDITALPGQSLSYFTFEHSIPGTLRSSTTEGILPLHVTLNIPVTQIRDRSWWNDMLSQWRSSGNIAEIFAQNLEIDLLTTTNGEANPWNLTQELEEKGTYTDQIKVFLDEGRGRSTQDNDPGLLTISFIVMLMNGTRDGLRPELSLVSDDVQGVSSGTSKEYIIIRDGINDTKWSMTFFVAPRGTITNTYGNNNNQNYNYNSDTPSTSSGGGGGGCTTWPGAIMLSGLMIVMISMKSIKGERRI